ncbi:hypothetical protein J0H58_17525, partial [bacterium]|nr:hypothetical protein [bacterium]
DYSMLNPDATRVVAPHADQNPFRMSVREYDLATGRHVELFPVPGRRPGGGGGGFGDFGEQWRALSPDGTLLVEGWDREAFVWDLRARSVRHHLTFPSTQTSRYQFAPDGKHLLTAAGDERAVRVWDLGTGKETGVLAWEGRGRGRGGASALAVSPDGRWVAAAVFDLPGNGAELAVWDRSGGGPPLLVTLPDGFGPGGDLVFGPGGALYAVSLPPEGTGTVVTRWDVATGRRVGRWAGLARAGTGAQSRP